MNNLIIKKASLKDWKNYKEIRLDALEKDPESFGSSYEEEKKRSEKIWKNKLSEKNRIALIAVKERRVVGILIIMFESGIKLAHIANIFSVYVKKEYRGKGISTELMREALKLIESRKGTRKINLHVTTNQLPAINLYKKFGFKIVGELKKELKIKNDYYNSYVMELILQK